MSQKNGKFAVRADSTFYATLNTGLKKKTTLRGKLKPKLLPVALLIVTVELDPLNSFP